MIGINHHEIENEVTATLHAIAVDNDFEFQVKHLSSYALLFTGRFFLFISRSVSLSLHPCCWFLS